MIYIVIFALLLRCSYITLVVIVSCKCTLVVIVSLVIIVMYIYFQYLIISEMNRLQLSMQLPKVLLLLL
jgi:hypothetical protein